MSGADAVLHNGAELDCIYSIWLGRSEYAEDPYFTGAIDDFAIYSTVLTELEEQECYRAIFSDGFGSGDTSVWLATQPVWRGGWAAYGHSLAAVRRRARRARATFSFRLSTGRVGGWSVEVMAPQRRFGVDRLEAARLDRQGAVALLQGAVDDQQR